MMRINPSWRELEWAACWQRSGQASQRGVTESHIPALTQELIDTLIDLERQNTKLRNENDRLERLLREKE